MVPKMIWREKHIAGEESTAANDTVDDENSKNCEDIPTNMDVNIVFLLNFMRPRLKLQKSKGRSCPKLSMENV